MFFSDIKLKRMAQLEKMTLYPVISSEFCKGIAPEEMLKRIADGGAKMVQMREKNCSSKERYYLACKFREITTRYKMLLIINDNIDIALGVDADGVHLGQSDFPIQEALKIAPNLIFGVSTHSVEQALATQLLGASYINIGPVFPTQTKQTPVVPLGIEMVKLVSENIKIPFSCMGGIKSQHIPILCANGARMIAMVTEITQSNDPTTRTKQLLSLF